MDILTRSKHLHELFSYDAKAQLDDSRLEILPFCFTQTYYEDEIKALQKELSPTGFCTVTDDCITENKSFNYTIFTPKEKSKSDKAIILLHGLNERSWDKYLTWAEYLAKTTGRSVILFPIAFHMNRSPRVWSTPRAILPWVNVRKTESDNNPSTTFVNVALSSRISRQPLRFYVSGLQSAYNILQLAHEIKAGKHPLFEENTSINIFAYSIGALLSEVLLLANTDGIFTDTKLFMFCGGSIFSDMNGCARDILDHEASEKLMSFYNKDFIDKYPIGSTEKSISLDQAFKMMLVPDVLNEQRENFFNTAYNRIRAISLKKDVVIPTQGVIKAIGQASKRVLSELDFPFTYSHQTPFPTNNSKDKELVNSAFRNVFDRASAFLI